MAKVKLSPQAQAARDQARAFRSARKAPGHAKSVQAAKIGIAVKTAAANRATPAAKSAARAKPPASRKFKPDNGPGFATPDHYERDRKGRFA